MFIIKFRMVNIFEHVVQSLFNTCLFGHLFLDPLPTGVSHLPLECGWDITGLMAQFHPLVVLAKEFRLASVGEALDGTSYHYVGQGLPCGWGRGHHKESKYVLLSDMQVGATSLS